MAFTPPSDAVEAESSFAPPSDATEVSSNTTEESSGAKAFGKGAASAVVPGLAGLSGFGAGAAMGAKIPGPPLLKAGGALVGGIVGAGGVSAAVKAVQDAVWEIVPEEWQKMVGADKATRAKEQQEHPTLSAAGEIVGGLAGGSPTTAVPKATSVIGKALGSASGQRAVSGVLQGGIDVGMQAGGDKPIDWKQAGMATVAGAAMPGLNVAGKKFADVGEKVGEKLVAAFRNKRTGETTPSSDPEKHDVEKKADANLEQGFITEQGEFLNRLEATKKAKEAGLIPPDKPVGGPDQGHLHTGDLKGEERVLEAPVSREEHKVRINEIDSMIEASIKDPKGSPTNPKELVAQKQALLDAMPEPEVKNKKALTLDEMKDVLWASRTVGEALTTLQRGGYGSKGQKLLTGLLLRSKLGSDAPFRWHTEEEGVLTHPTKTDEWTAGLYDIDKHEVIMASAYPEGYEGITRSMRDVLHEATHAAAHKFIDDPSNIHGQRLNALFQAVKSRATPEQLKLYGLTDPHEFLSEGFTKSDFKKFLDDIEIPGWKDKANPKGSAWVAFKEAIKNGIAKAAGLEAPKEVHTALDELLDIGGHLVEERVDKIKGKLGSEPIKIKPLGHPDREFSTIKEALASEENPAGGLWFNTKTQKWSTHAEDHGVDAINRYDSSGEMSGDASERWAIRKALNDGFIRVSGPEIEIKGKIDVNKPPKYIQDYLESRPDLAGVHVLDGSVQEPQTHTARMLSGYKAPERQYVPNPHNTKADPVKLGSEPLKKEVKKVDPRSIANEEEFMAHAQGIYETSGPEAATEFLKEWRKTQAEREVPLATDHATLDDALHKLDTYTVKDASEFMAEHKNNSQAGVTPELREKLHRAIEGEKVEYTPEERALLEGEWGRSLADKNKEVSALLEKVRKLTGDPRALRELETGMTRYRLFDKKARKWTDFFKSKENENPLGEKVAEEASATRERSVFQTEDGKVIQVQHNSKTDRAEVIEWKNGKPSFWKTKDGKPHGSFLALGEKGKRLTAGDTIKVGGKDVKITDGQTHNIERHSPFRYLKDAEATLDMKLMELRKQARDLEFIENSKKTDFFGQGRGPDTPLKDVPKGFRVPNNIDKIPQLRGWMFEPKTAAVIEDFAKVWDNHLAMKLSNSLMKIMFLNPIPHMFNEVAHLWNFRGLSSWVTPTGLSRFAETGTLAAKDVLTQSKFYRDIMKEGGSILGSTPRTNKFWDNIMKDGSERVFKDQRLAKDVQNMAEKFGFKAKDFYDSWSNKSQQAMWVTRDMMYVQAIRETMKLNEKRGTPVDLKKAIEIVEKHMPNYRMPSEVMGSRKLAQGLKNPNIALFSRYHYGVMKSMIETMKQVNPKNLKTVEGRAEFKDGLDSMLAMGVALAVVYPMIDTMLSSVLGEETKMRRAGPMHVANTAIEVLQGKKDPSALLWTVFTINPAATIIGQLLINKNIFTGKNLYHPDDPAGDIASDVGTYLAKQVPQATPIMQSTEEGSPKKFLARQVDVTTKSDKQLEKEERGRKYRGRTFKGRKTQRERGEYTP